MNPNIFFVLFGKPAICIEVSESLSWQMREDIEDKLPVCAYLHGPDTILISLRLPTDCEDEVRKVLWRWRFTVETKTTQDGEKKLCFRIVRRKKFFFF